METLLENNGFVRLHGLSKSFQEGGQTRAVLCGADAEFARGEFAAILGKSGSGKSTLLNLVSGIDLVDEGDIWVNGQRLTALNERQRTLFRRQNIGFIFQFFNLIPTLTALENVEFALELVEDNPEEMSRKALGQVGLSERADHFPSQLSGGEQQRVAIARAICKQPPILLCDEPTGELDFKTGKSILKVMQDINRDNHQTIILVTHNTAIAEMANRTVHLHSGELSEIMEVETPKDADQLVW